jgi:hypothetical protein
MSSRANWDTDKPDMIAKVTKLCHVDKAKLLLVHESAALVYQMLMHNLIILHLR